NVIRPYIERVFAGERVEYESEIPYRFGAESAFFRVVNVADRNADGVIIGWIACVSDITSSKQAERQLERNAQRDLAGKITRTSTFTYHHNTQALQLSPGSAAIYGLPEGTFEISRTDWRARVYPDDLPRVDAVARRALANRERELVWEFRILRHGEVR